MQEIIVYSARPESVLKILKLLRQAGLNPVALDNPDGTQQAYSAFNYLVRIAVPKDESQEARAVLAQWDKEVKPRVDELSRQFSRRWAYVTLGLAVIWGVAALSGIWVVFENMMMIGLLILLIYPFVYVYNRRKKRRDPRMPLSLSEEDQQPEDISENRP